MDNNAERLQLVAAAGLYGQPGGRDTLKESLESVYAAAAFLRRRGDALTPEECSRLTAALTSFIPKLTPIVLRLNS